MVADGLRAEGITVDLLPPGQVSKLDGYDAVVVGGALYAFRWHRQARRFVRRHAAELRQRPLFFFSSGPLDDSAARSVIPPVRQVRALMSRVGARDHMTIGGRLTPDAKGFPASAMARKNSGDWRDPAQVQQWAKSIAAQLQRLPQRPAARGRHGAAGMAVTAAPGSQGGPEGKFISRRTPRDARRSASSGRRPGRRACR
jgi:menaquinone-dependent protoporphyrinogen oxidase